MPIFGFLREKKFKFQICFLNERLHLISYTRRYFNSFLYIYELERQLLKKPYFTFRLFFSIPKLNSRSVIKKIVYLLWGHVEVK